MQQGRSEGLEFFSDLPGLAHFAEGLEAERFQPLPNGWLVGVADVVNSTGAIAAGRYKAVNMVGASVISAVLNIVGQRAFPFVFGGDGAAFALPAGFDGKLRAALAATRTWASEEMDLSLRVALVPIETVRAAGCDVTVARYAPNADIAYAMLSGGGITWAEGEMKAGRHAIPAAPPGTRPDLSGLSCRWSPSRTTSGVILSLLVRPAGSDGAAFSALAARLLARLQRLDGEGRPLPARGPGFSWRAPGLALEAKVPVGEARAPQPRWKLFIFTVFAWLLFVTGRRAGGFDPVRYRAKVVANSDYRKFDDGLKLTVDCSSAEANAIEALLEGGHRAGICHFGLHRQDAAIMTCVVPSYVRDDHFHFIDGAGGGYAAAAIMLKRSLAAPDASPGSTPPPGAC